eukprot:evm.model.scf_166.10 EVM.evm.TU.scf_166.10   scf_166:61097-63235(-)
MLQESQRLTFKSALGGLSQLGPSQRGAPHAINTGRSVSVTAKKKSGTISLPSFSKKATTINVSFSEEDFRDKVPVAESPAPRILSKIEKLKLLTKLEEARVLSTLESSGLTLSKIESLGLLSIAERLGVLSATSSRATPYLVYLAALGLLAAGPAVVYLTPDESTAQVIGQFAIAAVCAVGGAAAFGGASLLASLQQK